MTGEEFAKHRRRAHLTQQKLGELLGYQGRNAYKFVQSIEYNKREVPLRHIRKLSRLLGVPIEEFIP